jgi:Uncharacterized homolog of gamma-carboxymuconolactone decarboxylase subunit
MKRIVYLFVALLMMATADAQTLTERQKGLAACACLMAQGDMNRLEPTVRMALNKGVTINELKEAFSQLYAYTGFPRSLNALGVLSKVLENKQPEWQRRQALEAVLQSGMMLRRLRTGREEPDTTLRKAL